MPGARPTWYQRHVADLWFELIGRSRDAAALHLLLADLAFMLGSLPEDEAELRRVAGVSDVLWSYWPEIRDLWPVSGLRRGHTRARMNPSLGEAFSDAAEAVSTYRKRAKKAAAGRWKKDHGNDASSNASSLPEGMQRERVEKEKEKEKTRAPERASGAFSSRGSERGRGNPSQRLPVGRFTLPSRGELKLRDPFAPGVPAEVLAAAQKKRARDEWECSLEGTDPLPQPEQFQNAAFYGGDSRADERVRLIEWQEGADDAFIRNSSRRGA